MMMMIAAAVTLIHVSLYFLAKSDGPPINLISTPMFDDQASKLLTVKVVMVGFLFFRWILAFLKLFEHC